MEFLNNIWNAISTQNQGLINIILIFGSFIEAFLLLLLFDCILNIKSNKMQKFIYIISMSIVSLLSTYFIPSPFNSFFNYIIMFLLILYLFKVNMLKSIIAVVMSVLVFALLGSLILNPYCAIFKLTYEELLTIPIHRFIYLLIFYTCIFTISNLLQRKNLKLILLDEYDIKTKKTILINFILGFLTICVHLTITVYYTDILPLTITFLSFITLLAYFSISIYSLTKVTKLSIAKQQLESAEEYNKTLRILHDNVRCFKHDFDNIVTTIGGYIKTDDMEGLKKYYVRLEDDCQKVNNLYVLNPEIINNTGIYNLLTKKYHDAESKNIKINLTFLLDLNSLKMQIYDFAKIFGILLDNAIEASDEAEEKIINIIFRNEEKNSRQILIIENTYKDKTIDIDRIFSKGISGKKNHTGLGLWEIRELLRRNNNLNLHTTKNDKFFIQQFEIYY